MSFQLSQKTLKVPASLFRENRERLVDAIRPLAPVHSAIVLAGGPENQRYNTDGDGMPFRQESYFFWTFGVHESDCFGLIDVDTKKSVLFPPLLHPDFAIWFGKIEPESWFQKKYEVDAVYFNKGTIIVDVLKKLNIQNVLLLRAYNDDSKLYLEEPKNIPGLSSFTLNADILYPIMANLRVFKTDAELEVMRYSSKIATDAHKEVMRQIAPEMYEYEMESLFSHISYSTGGCRHLAYTCVAPSGKNTAILHYGHANAPNAKLIKDGDMCLFDMGPEYNCYGSDVTCSFPCNGKFTDQQKIVYNAVWAAHQAVFSAAKPGVRWTDMHILAEKVILTNLKAAEILQGDVDEMVQNRLGAIFMPHGLGHFLGLEAHDVGGYLGDALPRSDLPGLKNLRTTRTLQERMVITVEPGCYFIDTLLNQALNSQILSGYFNKTVLETYRKLGGVRIEDDVVIWKNGVENLSGSLPRTVQEIEAFMAKEKKFLNNKN